MFWKPYFHLGIVQYMAFPQTLDNEDMLLESLTSVALDPYFDVVEICSIEDDERRDEVKDIVEQSNLRLVYGAQPEILKEELNLASLDNSEGLRALNRLKEMVDEAYLMNAERFVIMDGLHSYPGPDGEEEAIRALKENLKELCAYVQAKGDMAMSIETFDRSVEKQCLLGPTKLAAETVREVSQEYGCFDLTLDLAHLGLLDEHFLAALYEADGIVTHIHLGNCFSDSSSSDYGDWHPLIGAEGGRFDHLELARFLRALLEIGIIRTHNQTPPILSFEVRPPKVENTRHYLAHCKRTIDRAWSLAN